MKSRLFVPVFLAAGVAAVAATAQTTAPPRSAPIFRGYLAVGAAPDTLLILPPPPKPGSAREIGDRAVFTATRALAGKPRWTLATEDANLFKGADLFSCALGVKLNAASAPALTGIFHRVGLDTLAVIDPPKNHYARPRPYTAADATTAPVCVAKSDALTRNGSYPSGHASVSWTWGLILAELAPDRATQILARARAIGDSRVVCGVHYLSDIEAGRTTGASLVATLHGDAAFRADMDRARAELAGLRVGAHEAPADCATQNQAADRPPY